MQQVLAVTIDSFVSRKSLDMNRLRLVKIDVDGHEDSVINGLKKLFSEGYRPILLTELSVFQGAAYQQRYPESLRLLGYSSYSAREGRLKAVNTQTMPAGFHGNIIWLTEPIAS